MEEIGYEKHRGKFRVANPLFPTREIVGQMFDGLSALCREHAAGKGGNLPAILAEVGRHARDTVTFNDLIYKVMSHLDTDLLRILQRFEDNVYIKTAQSWRQEILHVPSAGSMFSLAQAYWEYQQAAEALHSYYGLHLKDVSGPNDPSVIP